MTATRTLPALFGREVRAIHCVGIGGMGLGPLAIYLARLGYTVTGEDDAMTDAMRAHLERANIAIHPFSEIPHLLVISTAIAPSHPAFLAAKTRNIPIVRRGELLAEIVRDKKLVAICGSHGKTTTTAMLITALRRANFSAGYILGGIFADPSLPPADIGTTDYIVAEIDESDGTIEKFSPEITVATNLDWDHPDHYRTPADIEAAFQSLFSRTRHAVLSSVRSVQSDCSARYTFGTAETADYRYAITSTKNSKQALALSNRFPIPTAVIRALGDFNAANAAAALAAAHIMGATLTFNLLIDYPGVRRRQSILHDSDELTVIEDYAHHPAEIRALLASLRSRIPPTGRLLVVFQPHRYSRTAQFKTDFASALSIADRVYLLDVYPAGEAPVAGGATSDLHATLRSAAPALPATYHHADTPATLAALARDLRLGDTIAFVGAGDIDRAAREWLAEHANFWKTSALRLRAELSPASKIRTDEPLAPKTTMRTGGPARLYAEPATEADLARLLNFAHTSASHVLMLGRGSNLLVPDEGVDALVISLAHPDWHKFEILPNGLIHCGAGLRLKTLCGHAAVLGLAGFEFLEGIPGTLGGALRMNAGAMGDEIFNHVEKVRVMTETRVIRALLPDEMEVTYRRCGALAQGPDFEQYTFALSATLRPAGKKSPDEINALIETYRAKRQLTQPREPSAGSIFKNPPNDSAGRLIDTAGLKGFRIGGAEVSTLHANFIINPNNTATTTDIIELIRHIRATVAEKHNITLEPEVMLYGANWKNYL